MIEATLYIKNLDGAITEDKLKELFSEFGTITFCEVVVDHRRMSKGFGFVAFSNPEEAKKAMAVMTGKMVGQKILYVLLAQPKLERMTQLRAQFVKAISRPPVTPRPATPLPARILGLHPRAPNPTPQPRYLDQDNSRLLAPPGFGFPHGNRGLLPPHGYGFLQQPIMAGAGPSNFSMAYAPRRQDLAENHLGPIRIGCPQAMPRQLMPHGPNRHFEYMFNGKNLADHQMIQALMGDSMLQVPFDASTTAASSWTDVWHSGHIRTESLVAVLDLATPESQRDILGELLYSLVEKIEPKNAVKVTGMLLEMDQRELLHLLKYPEALKEKVVEAMDMLIVASAFIADDGNQIGSFSFDE